jgi:hypothetical protein
MAGQDPRKSEGGKEKKLLQSKKRLAPDYFLIGPHFLSMSLELDAIKVQLSCSFRNNQLRCTIISVGSVENKMPWFFKISGCISRKNNGESYGRIKLNPKIADKLCQRSTYICMVNILYFNGNKK